MRILTCRRLTGKGVADGAEIDKREQEEIAAIAVENYGAKYQ